MKKIFTILSLLLFLNLFAQKRNSESETLRELYELMKKNNRTEFEAKKTVLNFYYNTKNEVRPKLTLLSESEKDIIEKSQTMLWKKVEEIIKLYQYQGYNKFLEKQYNSLLKYNESINDLLYLLIEINYDEEKDKQKYDDLLYEKYWQNWMEKP